MPIEQRDLPFIILGHAEEGQHFKWSATFHPDTPIYERVFDAMERDKENIVTVLQNEYGLVRLYHPVDKNTAYNLDECYICYQGIIMELEDAVYLKCEFPKRRKISSNVFIAGEAACDEDSISDESYSGEEEEEEPQSPHFDDEDDEGYERVALGDLSLTFDERNIKESLPDSPDSPAAVDNASAKGSEDDAEGGPCYCDLTGIATQCYHEDNCSCQPDAQACKCAWNIIGPGGAGTEKTTGAFDASDPKWNMNTPAADSSHNIWLDCPLDSSAMDLTCDEDL